MFNFSSAWLRQPTTLIGLFGAVALLALGFFGKVDWTTAGIGLAACLGLAGINDNTAEAADLQAVAADMAAGQTAGNIYSVLPKLIGDAVKAAHDLTAKPAVPASGGGDIQAATLAQAARTAGALVMFLAVCLSLAACANMTAAQKTQALSGLACRLDQTLQPIAADMLASLVPKAQLLVTVDQLAVHPAVVSYCASLGGTVLTPLPAAPDAAATKP